MAASQQPLPSLHAGKRYATLMDHVYKLDLFTGKVWSDYYELLKCEAILRFLEGKYDEAARLAVLHFYALNSLVNGRVVNLQEPIRLLAHCLKQLGYADVEDWWQRRMAGLRYACCGGVVVRGSGAGLAHAVGSFEMSKAGTKPAARWLS